MKIIILVYFFNLLTMCFFLITSPWSFHVCNYLLEKNSTSNSLVIMTKSLFVPTSEQKCGEERAAGVRLPGADYFTVAYNWLIYAPNQ